MCSLLLPTQLLPFVQFTTCNHINYPAYTNTRGHNTLMRFMFKHRHNRRPLSVPSFSLSLAHSPPDSFNYYRCILICDSGGGVVAVSGMPMLSATRPSAPYAGVFFSHVHKSHRTNGKAAARRKAHTTALPYVSKFSSVPRPCVCVCTSAGVCVFIS